MPSLRRQLASWLLIPLLAFWGINTWVNYETAVESADRAHDRTLLGSVLAIAERISVIDDAIVVDLPYSALEMLESSIQGRVYYRVSQGERTITGYDDLRPPRANLELGKPLFYDADYRGERVRVAALAKPLYHEAFKGPAVIQVAETAELRQSMSRQMMLDSALKELLLILLAAGLMWMAVNRGLRPLYQLRNQVSQRARTDLSRIESRLVPSELKPLIDAINEHTSQISQVISAQKQFIADAAHQLKTPLTLLRTQADFASKQDDLAAVNEVLDDLRRNTERVSHLVNQLLALNRAEAETVVELAELDLTELARSTTFECLPLALKKSIDLGFESEGPLMVMGHKFLLQELLTNLIDNALRFTPESGHVTVRVATRGDWAVLSVEDSGPGIPESERRRVFDRFYQMPGRDSPGCGLGLAIAKEITMLHRARISVQDPPGHSGTSMELELALLETATASRARRAAVS